MNGNESVLAAGRKKDDEFYTRIGDIEDEMVYYTDHFRNKTIYLPCDNANSSKFWIYFKDNFHKLELKHLIATSLDPIGFNGDRFDYDGKNETHKKLQYNGSFQSYDAQKIMDEEAEISITNPPFSLYTYLFQQLNDFGQEFILLCPNTAFDYKKCRIAFEKNEIRMGVNRKGMKFDRPDGTVKGIGHARWMTTLEHGFAPPFMQLTETWSEDKYDFYDGDAHDGAIDVKKIELIPKDWPGLMGVPLNFLDKFNPEQFELKGFHRNIGHDLKINGKPISTRLIIKNKSPS